MKKGQIDQWTFASIFLGNSWSESEDLRWAQQTIFFGVSGFGNVRRSIFREYREEVAFHQGFPKLLKSQ